MKAYDHYMCDIDSLATTVKEQADRLFPNRTDQSMFLKLYAETAECIRDPGPDEIADVFILWLDYARRKDIDIEAAIYAKMNVNEQREWKQNSDTGVYQHVKRN